MIDYSLYLVTDRYSLKGKDLFEATKKAIKGGVSLVQLREKELSFKEFLQTAIQMKQITDQFKIPLIINDNIQIAKQINCSGVHVGQDDESLEKARQILGDKKIIGVSVENEEQAIKACRGGADYLGIGTVFFTPTKKDIKKPIGLKKLEKIVEKSSVPTVAIGGINLDNIDKIMKCGVNGAAIISAILSHEDIQKISQKFLKIIKENRWKK